MYLRLLVHARPDGDCIGSAFAMSVLLGELGCETRIVCSDKLPERLKFIGEGIQEEILPDGATGAFAAGGRAISLDVASPTQLGELEGKYNILLAIDHHARKKFQLTLKSLIQTELFTTTARLV